MFCCNFFYFVYNRTFKIRTKSFGFQASFCRNPNVRISNVYCNLKIVIVKASAEIRTLKSPDLDVQFSDIQWVSKILSFKKRTSLKSRQKFAYGLCENYPKSGSKIVSCNLKCQACAFCHFRGINFLPKTVQASFWILDN